MHDTKLENQRGFSLAEVLVAVALLSVILLALFGLVTAGVHRTYGGRKMTEGAVLAEAVMERVNVPQPQALFGAAGTDTTAGETWDKTGPTAVAPSAVGGTPTPERDLIRQLLVNAPLPANATHPAELDVRIEPLPTGGGLTFANASMLRITVVVRWRERGVRQRTVHLEAVNLPAPI